MEYVNRLLSGNVKTSSEVISTIYPLDYLVCDGDLEPFINSGNIERELLDNYTVGTPIPIKLVADNSNLVKRILNNLDKYLSDVIDSTFHPALEGDTSLLGLNLVVNENNIMVLEVTISYQ